MAAGTTHWPLYFEQLGPERYGVSTACTLQPLLSAAHFFGSVVILPARMLVEPPYQCQSTLGLYRPGSRLPYLVHRTCYPVSVVPGRCD